MGKDTSIINCILLKAMKFIPKRVTGISLDIKLTNEYLSFRHLPISLRDTHLHSNYGGRHQKSCTALVVTLTLLSEKNPIGHKETGVSGYKSEAALRILFR